MGLFGMPGIGDSLGCCAVCDKPFVMEILLGTNVRTITMPLFEDEMCVHEKCVPILEQVEGDWESLPEGPIRRGCVKVAEHNERLAKTEVKDAPK